MAKNKEVIRPEYDLDAKWDACLDLTLRRFAYSTLAGAFGGLLFFSQSILTLSLFFFYFLFFPVPVFGN